MPWALILSTFEKLSNEHYTLPHRPREALVYMYSCIEKQNAVTLVENTKSLLVLSLIPFEGLSNHTKHAAFFLKSAKNFCKRTETEFEKKRKNKLAVCARILQKPNI